MDAYAYGSTATVDDSDNEDEGADHRGVNSRTSRDLDDHGTVADALALSDISDAHVMGMDTHSLTSHLEGGEEDVTKSHSSLSPDKGHLEGSSGSLIRNAESDALSLAFNSGDDEDGDRELIMKGALELSTSDMDEALRGVGAKSLVLSARRPRRSRSRSRARRRRQRRRRRKRRRRNRRRKARRRKRSLRRRRRSRHRRRSRSRRRSRRSRHRSRGRRSRGRSRGRRSRRRSRSVHGRSRRSSRSSAHGRSRGRSADAPSRRSSAHGHSRVSAHGPSRGSAHDPSQRPAYGPSRKSVDVAHVADVHHAAHVAEGRRDAAHGRRKSK